MKNKNNINAKYSKFGYIFVIPFTIAFLFFMLYPIFYTAFIGFTGLKGLGNTISTPGMGLLKENVFKNFKDVITNGTFQQSMKNTVKMWVLNFIPQILLALLLTSWFTDKRSKVQGEGIFKVIFYLPNIITAATVAILFGALFGYPMGPMNDLLSRFGFIDEPVHFFLSKNVAQGVVIFIQTWMWYGYTTVNIIAGVNGISPEIFESAEVDGASRTQTFFQITLPNIKTIMLFILVTSLIGGLNMFDIPKLLVTNSGPDNATKTTSVFIYDQAFAGSYLYNKAGAASMIMFLIIVILSAVLFYIMRDKDEAALKKMKKQQDKLRLAELKAQELLNGKGM